MLFESSRDAIITTDSTGRCLDCNQAAVEMFGCAAKAGLLAMVTNLQMELEGTGVRASVVHPGPTQTEMGWSLPPERIGPALEDWARWGQARHSYFLRAADLARAIAFVAETPRGGFVVSMELQPEAPLSDAPKERQQLKYPEGS